ncbi:XrtA system polysaccharide chain length determinant [Kordiimonas marina]|uniref:XrtA system polysaccharide chain length determinant n=1 Tax=Kordiimonas marina TaxID=2872312 RepID=UPI001FF6F357|nr:XrtA system polysaccharide chain length determinant [Kordiimonas marina]MCJ9430366.1 hypothetical protein [Kordiimonas marina]
MADGQLGLHEVFQQIKAFAYGIWRKKWYMLITSWVICLAGWSLVAMMPYRYEASAQVFVDTETLLPQIARNLGVNVDLMRQVDIMQRTLTMRPNLEKVIRLSGDLEHLAASPKDMDAMVAELQRNIRVIQLSGGMFRIQFAINDSRLSDRARATVARSVVSNLVSFFLERNTTENTANSENASEFLDQQIKDYKGRLEAAERAQAKFEQENIEYLGGEGSFLSRLDSARADLRKTNQKIAEMDVALKSLQDQIKNVPPTIREARSARSGGSAGDRDPLEERISDLEKKLDKLKTLGYKDKHPDVVNVSRQIENLKAELKKKQDKVEEELQSSAETGKKSSLTTETPNRLYEQMMLQIIQTTTDLKSMQQRATEQKKLITEMEEKAKRVPEIQAAESQLKRDYKTIKQQYNELVQQQQNLEIRKSVEGAGQSVALRVVEPPSVPKKPSGPNRLLFMTATLFGGLLGGIGVALVLSQLRPVVITVDQLRAHFDLPVLGNVTRTLSEEENRQRSYDLLGFAGATAGLFLTFIIFIALDVFVGPSVS